MEPRSNCCWSEPSKLQSSAIVSINLDLPTSPDFHLRDLDRNWNHRNHESRTDGWECWPLVCKSSIIVHSKKVLVYLKRWKQIPIDLGASEMESTWRLHCLIKLPQYSTIMQTSTIRHQFLTRIAPSPIWRSVELVSYFGRGPESEGKTYLSIKWKYLLKVPRRHHLRHLGEGERRFFYNRQLQRRG